VKLPKLASATPNEKAALEVALRALRMAQQNGGGQVHVCFEAHSIGGGVEVAILPNNDCECWSVEDASAIRR
jgi:hypothetical protein